MRQLKFRVWDKRTKRFLDENDNVPNFIDLVPCDTTGQFCPMYIEFETSTTYNSDLIVMQYTDLKDKCGEDIWEGDILQWPREADQQNGHLTFIVEYKADSKFGAGFFLRNIKSEPGAYPIIITSNIYEVIGNIYSNPELLK